MIMRFNFSAALPFVLACNFVFVAVAKSEDSVQDSEREFAESLFPILKTIREFSEKIDENVAKFRRLSDGKSRRSRSNIQADPASKELDQLPDVPIEKSREQLQKDLLNELTYAHRRQNELVRDMELKLRVYVSTSVDRCKRHITAGDEVGARASCAIAQEKISQCSRKVEPEINQRADRLNAEYKSIYRDMDNISVSFSKIHCNLVFNGIEDPGKLLRAANLQLPDTSCYAHTEEVKKFAKTGVMQNRLGKDDASVPAYLSYIQRKCPERIASQARLAVEEILRAKTDEGRKLKENEEQGPLTRDGSRSGSGMFRQAIGQAEQEEKDRPAREARERAAQARAAEQEWIEKQKAIAAAHAAEQEQARKDEQNARETREALGQLIGAIGQIQQNKVDRKQAAYEEQQAEQAQLNQRRQEEQQRREKTMREQEALARGREENIARAQEHKREQELANQRAYQERNVREVAAINERLASEAEQQKIEHKKRQEQLDAIRKAKAEEAKYYPPLACATTVVKRYNNGKSTRNCFQNNCGRTIVAYGPNAMTHIKAGETTCSFTYLWACERGNVPGVLGGDAYDRDRQMCKGG